MLSLSFTFVLFVKWMWHLYFPIFSRGWRLKWVGWGEEGEEERGGGSASEGNVVYLARTIAQKRLHNHCTARQSTMYS